MGSLIRRFFELTMNALSILLLAVAVSSAPLEDTAEVAAAKAEFKAAFNLAEAGGHAALAPVNNDIQAEQIANAYLDDTEDVALAKAAFKAAFDDAAAGGLATKQEPAPIHIVSAPTTAHAELDASVEPAPMEATPVADPVVHALPIIA